MGWCGLSGLLGSEVMDDPSRCCSSLNGINGARRIGANIIRIFDHNGQSKGYVVLLGIAAEHRNTRKLERVALAVIIVLGTVFAVYVYAAEKARSALTSAQSIRTFNRITGTALGGAAVWIAAK